jgi:hypothetical protein
MGTDSDILEILAVLMSRQEPVKLLNTYHGLPILYEAQIKSIMQGYVTLGVHKHQLVCMFLENETSLISKSLPARVDARVVSLDVVKKQVVLAEFTEAGKSDERRQAVRVRPEGLIDVNMRIGQESYSGKLADVSVRGMGVYSFDTYLYGDQAIEKNTDIELELQLPVVDYPLKVSGKIMNTIPHRDPSLHRIGIRLRPDDNIKWKLQEYVAIRRDELHRELNLIYDSMLLMREKA